MTPKGSLQVSSAALLLVAFAARAQEGEPTITAIPDPEVDLPSAVTDAVPFPDEASDEGASRSEAGRAGEGRETGLATASEAAADGLAESEANAAEGAAEAAANAADGLATAEENAAEAAADGLSTARDAVEGNREDFGRSNAPDSLPDQVADLPDTAPEGLPAPDVPVPPAGAPGS